MQIETYEEQEITGGIDELASMKEISAELGLNGQNRYLSGTERVSAFRKMTQVEMLVYRQILPESKSVGDYAEGPIPLRVLQCLKTAKESGIFKEFKIWHPENVKDDPLLIGIAYHPNPEYRDKNYFDGGSYILARWGEVLESFETLKQKALSEAKKKITLWSEQTILEKAA